MGRIAKQTRNVKRCRHKTNFTSKPKSETPPSRTSLMDSNKTWPGVSPGARFSSLPLQNSRKRLPDSQKKRRSSSRGGSGAGGGGGGAKPSPSTSSSTAKMPRPNFSDLPFDMLARIAASFDVPNLWAASMVCQSWREALRPLREAMVLLRWGKRFKHGHVTGGGITVRPDALKALDSFLHGAARGSAPAMVDAGLMYWEMGRKEEGKALYRKAAELGYPAAQCNLGICYLEAERPVPEEAVKWFYRAAESGYARAQYNLALCLHKGRGVKCNIPDAGKWYLRAAEGGNVRAMYNTSLCYSSGEGLSRNHQRARIWMKRAADCGHRKAQFEHGLELFSSGDVMKALVYLELATRAGETAASHIRNVILQSLSPLSRDRAMLSADNWQPIRFPR